MAIAPRAAAPRCGLLPAVLGLALAAGLGAPALAQTPSFTIIPHPPGAGQWIDPTGNSADGRVVCGVSLTPGAFIWTAETGRVDIAGSGGVPFQAQANAISGDGQTVVGAAPGGTAWSAFRYRGPGTYEALDLSFGGRTDCQATGVSGDGSVIVGSAADANYNSYAVRWTAQTGAQELLGGGGYHEEARCVSRDGSTILGFAIANGSGGSDSYTVVWRNGVMGARLMPPDGYEDAGAGVLNFDGSILVGGGYQLGIPHLLMWRDGTPIDLGVPTGFDAFGARAVDDAGDVVVGRLISSTSVAASIWTPSRGIEKLADYLQANGVQIPSGYALVHATGVSADGRTIVGAMYSQGQGDEAFVATIPTPGAAGSLAVGALALARRRRGSTQAKVTPRPVAMPHPAMTGRVAIAPRAAAPRCGLLPAVLGLALAAGLAAPARAQTPSFTLITPERTGGGASGVSADGQSVTGVWVSSTATVSYIWHASTGRYDFGSEPGILGMVPFGISGDGQTVVGRGSTTTGQAGACRWSGPGTFQILGTLGSYVLPTARGASNDGSVIVGEAQDSTGNFGQAFRWTASGGMQGLGYVLPGSTYSTAQAVSRDGSTIVGWSKLGGHYDGFRWTEGSGMAALPWLSAIDGSGAYGVNFDGSIIVGDSGNHAMQWRNGQIVDLGYPLGWQLARAQCVSDDGNVAAGFGYFSTGVGQGACVWTPATGMVPLSDYLTANGVTIPAGWWLLDCTGVSADGMTFVGNGGNGTQGGGFIATIPSPGALAVGVAALAVASRRRRRFADGTAGTRSQ